MRRCWSLSRIVLGLALASAIPATAQTAWQPGHAGIGFGQQQDKQWVRMVSSPVFDVKAGGKEDVELRFAIQSGLHINSHTPHSRWLIPTVLTLDHPAGVEIAKAEYPQGVDYHFDFSPKDAVSVYTGEFSVRVLIHARPGHYALHGHLHYQACDDRTCNPPKTLPVTLNLAAR